MGDFVQKWRAQVGLTQKNRQWAQKARIQFPGQRLDCDLGQRNDLLDPRFRIPFQKKDDSFQSQRQGEIQGYVVNN